MLNETLCGVHISNLIFYAVCLAGIVLAVVLHFSNGNQAHVDRITVQDRDFEQNTLEPAWWNTRR